MTSKVRDSTRIVQSACPVAITIFSDRYRNFIGFRSVVEDAPQPLWIWIENGADCSPIDLFLWNAILECISIANAEAIVIVDTEPVSGT